MMHAASRTLSTAKPTRNSRAHVTMDRAEMSFIKKSRRGISSADAERAWFAGLLRRAFPDATSENELAELVAEVLTSDCRPVTSRTVRNWIRQENTPHFRYVLAVIALAGSETFFQFIDREHQA